MRTARPGDEHVQAAFCAVLCDEWARAGVTDAVVAPGSRSTPMVAALDADERIRVTVVLDERSAGFTALGLGLSTGRPAVVVTTSGTASVELHPAVIEAGQAFVPLIAVTTDRPPELHQVGAPQTVEQSGLFGPVVRWAADPGVADLSSSGMWRSVAARAVAEALAGPGGPGPVHLNLPFREPLLGDAAGVDAPPGRDRGRPWHEAVPPASARPPHEVVELLCRHAGGRGLIVAGQGADQGGAEAVLQLAEGLGWPLLADPRSGCRVASPWVVTTADPLLRTARAGGWIPDVVLRIGTPWASKVLNQWLAGLPAGTPQVLMDPWGRWADPERRASHLVRSTAPELLDALGVGGAPGVVGATGPGPAAGNSPSDWLAAWQDAERAARPAIDALLSPGSELELSEPAVARAALCSLPDDGTLVVSSSMPVRDVEWYGPPTGGGRVLSNRGANGIDGVVATAVGVALGRPHARTLALLGDLAFVYDAGSLLWAARRTVDLRLLVVDNDGGGIFSFLPQASALPAEQFERYWGTPHGLDLARLAAAYGVEADRVGSRRDLEAFLSASGSGIRVGIVPSDRVANVAAHDRLNAGVAEAVAQAVPIAERRL